MLTYVALLFKELVLFENDSNSTVNTIVDIDEQPDVSYNDTFYQPQFSIEQGSDQELKYDDDLKRFITIKMTSTFYDANVYPPEVKEIDIGIRLCNVDDFNTPT